MGSKRSHDLENEIDDTRSTSETKQRRPVKRPRPKTSSSHSTSSTIAINPIKAKIRDVARLLERSDNLPAGVRIEKERALATYKQDLAEAETEKRKQQMISKYHMVRFFERQKATRVFKRLKARIADTDQHSAEYEDLQKAAHVAEVDVNYALYHPLNQKYQSIYPRNGYSDATTKDGIDKRMVGKTSTSKPAMWKLVEICMTEGTLEALRNGRLRGSLPLTSSQQPTTTAASQNKSGNEKLSAKKNISQETEDGSDGGFFEE